jgi:hypothetical protein
MEQFSWAVTLLVFLPQVLLVITLTIRLSSNQYRHGFALAVTIIYIPFLIMMRQYLPVGAHTVISLIAVPMLIAIVLKQTYRYVLFWFVIISSAVLMMEILTFVAIGRTLQEIQSLRGRVLYALPANFVLFALFFILFYNDWRKGKSLRRQ